MRVKAPFQLEPVYGQGRVMGYAVWAVCGRFLRHVYTFGRLNRMANGRFWG